MDAYVYQAALVCGKCGSKIRKELARRGDAPLDPKDERSYDSDRFPKGPYSKGGGEADSPQHCDSCGVFLENPLTGDGYQYVEDAVRDDLRAGKRNSVAVKTWAPFYDIDVEKRESVTEYRQRQLSPMSGFKPCECGDRDHGHSTDFRGCGKPAIWTDEHGLRVCDDCAEKREHRVESIKEQEATFKCADCGTHCDAGCSKCPQCGSDEIYPVDDDDEYEAAERVSMHRHLTEAEPEPKGRTTCILCGTPTRDARVVCPACEADYKREKESVESVGLRSHLTEAVERIVDRLTEFQMVKVRCPKCGNEIMTSDTGDWHAECRKCGEMFDKTKAERV